MYQPNYDPNDLSRYSASVSMAYYPSNDPTLVAAAMSRDHTSSTFGGTDQSKYSRTGDGTATVTSQQSQQGMFAWEGYSGTCSVAL